MTDKKSTTRHMVEAGESFIGHVAAVVIGFVLMVVGLALGVTMIMLPLGLVVGIAGLLLVVWGLFERAKKRS
jgi:hypothetical protein